MTAPTLGQLFDQHLAEKRETEDSPQSRKLDSDTPARASALGSCFQAQWMKGRGVPETKISADPFSLRTFANGHLVADHLVDVMTERGLVVYGPEVSGGETRLYDEDLDLAAHVDLLMLLDGALTLDEIKTTNPFSFGYTVKDTSPKESHRIQVGAMLALGQRHPEQLPEPGVISEARISYWSYGEESQAGKIPLTSKTFVIDMDQAITDATQRAIILKGFKASDTPPACECAQSCKANCPERADGNHKFGECDGWSVEYCSYSTLVSETENHALFECCDGATFLRRKKAFEKKFGVYRPTPNDQTRKDG